MMIRLFLFCFGAIGYGAIEILYRGNTHWSMLLAGGFAMVLLEQLNRSLVAFPLLARCAVGALMITGIELVFGLVFNRVLQLGVWDYSAQWGNVLGQICPLFTFLWFLLCIPVFGMLSLAAQWLQKPF